MGNRLIIDLHLINTQIKGINEMKNITYDVKLPDWSLCYLINGDPFESGTEEQNMQDKAQVDNYMKLFYDVAKELNGSAHISILNDEPYFSHSPAFGMASNVNDCEIIILY